MKHPIKIKKPLDKDPFIQIWYDKKEMKTAFRPFQDISTIKVAMALASATRVISAAFCDAMGLGKEHLEKIQDQIAEIYVDDLKMGSLGEEKSTKLV